jgi:hypothetical protein
MRVQLLDGTIDANCLYLAYHLGFTQHDFWGALWASGAQESAPVEQYQMQRLHRWAQQRLQHLGAVWQARASRPHRYRYLPAQLLQWIIISSPCRTHAVMPRGCLSRALVCRVPTGTSHVM